jgi:hypothetical protein
VSESSITTVAPSLPKRSSVWATSAAALALAGALWIAVRQPAPAPEAQPPAAPPVAPKVGTLRVDVLAGGKAVEGAEVIARAADDFRVTSETDENGQAFLPDCPQGSLAIVVAFPGLERAQRSFDLVRREGMLRVELAPGAFLRGEVSDENGEPIRGATLVARVIGDSRIRSQDPWSITADAYGNFVFDTLPQARITIEVSDGGSHETTVVPEVALPDETPISIVMRRNAGIHGRVVQAEQSISGAQVTLAGSGVWPPRTAMSDGQGEFHFGRVPAGVYEVRAERPGATSAPLEGIVVSPGNEARIELVLTPATNWRGSVRDVATGRPLAAAEIEVSEESLSATPRKARSDAGGRFELPSLRAWQHRVTVKAPGYVSAQSWATPSAEPLELALLRAASIAGIVEDESGRALAGVEIEVSGRSETGYPVRMLGPINQQQLGPPLPDATGDNLGVTTGSVPRVPLMPPDVGAPLPDVGLATFRSDANGEFRLDGLPPGELELAARKLGFGTGRSAKLKVQSGAELDDVRIVLPRGALLRGRVLDAQRFPLAHVRVELTASGEPTRSTVSDDDGTFHFDGARAPAIVLARGAGFAQARRSVAPNDLGPELELVIENASDRLRGRVLDARGAAIDGASVRVERAGASDARQLSASLAPTTLSSDNGEFEFAALPAPPYVLRVEHPDYAPSGPLTVNDASSQVQVRLAAGAALSGVVLHAQSGQPLPMVKLSVSAGHEQRVVRSGSDGSFRFPHLPVGSFTLRAEQSGFASELRQGTLGPGPHGLELEMVRAGSASGEVVDRRGATVWNAEVAPGSPPQWELAVRTDHAGHFRLAQLPPGEQILTARFGTVEMAIERAVRVYAGSDSPGLVIRLPSIVDPAQVPEPRVRAHEPAPVASERTLRRPSAIALEARGPYVVIEHVAPNSAGERSGLLAGDLLLSVDSEPVRSPAQARGMLSLSGSRARTLEVRRDGSTKRLVYNPRM